VNRFQKLVLALAAANAIVIALFPPYDVQSMLKGTPVFDAFHPIFAPPPNGLINANLLYISLFGVFGNAALVWLLLASGKDGRPRFDTGNLVVILAIANLMLVFLFPPFETPPVAGRFGGGGGFDGFQFALGGSGERRTIFIPLLYIEVIFVLLNACVAWLALRERAAAAVMDEAIGEMISEDERTKAEIEARVKQGVEDRIKEEARAAGRASAARGKPH
jgi:hypothetical protein